MLQNAPASRTEDRRRIRRGKGREYIDRTAVGMYPCMVSRMYGTVRQCRDLAAPLRSPFVAFAWSCRRVRFAGFTPCSGSSFPLLLSLPGQLIRFARFFFRFFFFYFVLFSCRPDLNPRVSLSPDLDALGFNSGASSCAFSCRSFSASLTLSFSFSLIIYYSRLL